MKTPDKNDFNEPGAEFGLLWNKARWHAQTKDEISRIIEKSRRKELKVRRIWQLSFAASVILCVGLVGVFKPFDSWILKTGMLVKDTAKQEICVPVFSAKTPAAKASSDTFHRSGGAILMWHPDSSLQYQFEFQWKIPGIKEK